jgi:hypothetical protein
MRGNTPSKTVNVDLTGKQELALIATDGGDGATADWADWANASVTCGAAGGDTTPPTVAATVPSSSATRVAVGANLAATFSEAMAATSISTTTFTVVRQGTTTVIAGAVTYNATTRVATLNPTADLAPNTTYVATVKGGAAGAKDLAGNPLTADKSWTFKTSP